MAEEVTEQEIDEAWEEFKETLDQEAESWIKRMRQVVEETERIYAFCPTGEGGGIDNSCSSTGDPGGRTGRLPTEYKDIKDWIDSRAKEDYRSKNEFLASEEYRKAYPFIQDLYKAEKLKTVGAAKVAMKSVGARVGDRVFYDYVTPFGVEKYSGIIILRSGIPYINLDEGQTTSKNTKSVRWHKGWRKVDTRKKEFEHEYSCVYCGLKRYHLPGQHDQCDHSPTGECSKDSVEDLDKIEELDQHEHRWKKDLSGNEESSIKLYTEASSTSINSTLRKGSTISSSISSEIDYLDSAIAKSKLPIDMAVYRGAVLKASQLDQLTRGFEQEGGISISDKGYVSTTRSLSKAISFTSSVKSEIERNVLFKVSLKKGFTAAPIERISSLLSEREVLLPRSQKFRVVRIEKDKMLRGDRWKPTKIDAVITVEAA